MSDYDRGPYAPGGEPPLAFAPAGARSRRGPAPVTLILSVLLLAVVGGGVVYLYRGGARGAGDAPQPVGAPLHEVRSAAPPLAVTPDPAAGLSIYKDDAATAAAAP
ncbi:MAG: SPOR domain-containing protein, partial [Caulobacteraceae bacterium]|nr:SPOR domain-containing protein [Caulobacteraceae bacterium]